MTTHTHQTAPTQFVEVNSIRLYGHHGPLGPAVTDSFARNREVILFDNAGVSSSSGQVPGTFAEMGANAIAFIRALELKQVALSVGCAGIHALATAQAGADQDQAANQIGRLQRDLLRDETADRESEQVESGRRLGLELAFTHGIDLGRGRGIGI